MSARAIRRAKRFVSALLCAALAISAGVAQRTIEISPNGSRIGFDDVSYSDAIAHLIVPAGASGAIALIDPTTFGVEKIQVFDPAKDSGAGHGEGVTSADATSNQIAAADRTSRALK